MERPEAVEVAGVVMTGLSEANVIAGLEEVIVNQKSSQVTLPEGYEVENFSERVVRFILSTASRHHSWAGIRKLD
jgi:UDP-N-acetylglucosamine 2-epimerase (non-hydrolysing)